MAAFYLVVLFVGVYAARSRLRDRDTGGLLVAGRRMPLWIGVFTMTATWVGGGYLNGTAEAVYDPARGLVWCQAPWGFALSLMVGGLVFAGPMRRAGYTTMLDPFAERYGKRIAAVLFLPALMGEIFWSAAILAALGMTFATVLGFDVTTSILISAAVAIGYTVVGGLWSVACTDVVQLLCIVGGLSLAIPFALDHAGGAPVALSFYLDQLLAQDPFPGNTLWNWLDVGIMLILGGIPWQVYFQRVLACRDERTAVRLSLIAGVACFAMALPAVLIGVVGASADWTAAGVSAPSSPAMVLPHVIYTLTPPIVATVALGAIAAAVMSSVDSSILSAASLFTWNVYRPLVRRRCGDREVLLAARVATLVIGALTTWLALTVQSVYVLWYFCADVVYVVLFPQLLLVLFSKRAHPAGVVAGLAAGVAFRLAGGIQELGFPALVSFPMGSDFPLRTAAMLANLTITWTVSILYRTPRQAGTKHER